ncbi:MAG: ABC transporter ATP-binding protein/permease, partial [Bdellovibrionales bacterium]|nr:ABC transporter ATP-binding protein/permease [Bdellovibrionales bacterium]
ISLGAVVPFLGVLIAPEKVFNYKLAVEVSSYFGITRPQDLLLPLTIIFACAALFGAGIRMLLLWTSTRVVYAAGSDISYEVYRRTLYQPYLIHLGRNSSEVSSGISFKVGYTIGVMYQTMVLITSLVLVSILMIALLSTKSFLPLVSAVGFGSCYIVISFFFRKKLNYNSTRIANESTQVMKTIQEGMGGIRDVLLDGTQELYCNIYRKADYPLQFAVGNNIFIGGSPRFIMEAVGMLLIAIMAYTLSFMDGGVASALPLLGALALGAQRLLPSLQQSYASWVGIVSAQMALKETLDFLDQPLSTESLTATPEPLNFSKEIKLENVSFKYNSEAPFVLDNITLVIPKGVRLGITGGTGSGKSTMLDLLMGLINPTSGSLKVDGNNIQSKNIRSWQRTIAHVPQSIYLADASLAENIAFGVAKENIDMERVKFAAKKAKIDVFAENCADGYETSVGERGARLSGGQRQRIGIARALYKEASVLIFDEATSALDNSTEQEVMGAIESLDSDLTIIIVAHRLTTIKKCDIVVEVAHGKIVGMGKYDQLVEASESFKKMVNANA